MEPQNPAEKPPRKRRARNSRSDGAPDGATDGAPNPLWALAWDPQNGVRTLHSFDDVRAAYSNAESRLWIDLDTPDRELLLKLGKVLTLHPLITEDILERNQRAKVEITGDALHVVMFGLEYEGEVVAHEIDFVLEKRFLLTSHDSDINLRDASFMRRDPGAHLAEGADFVLWTICDWLVDDYFPVFDRLGDEIDDLEADVMNKPSSWVVERLFSVRRDLLQIRHAVNPQREIFNQLTNRDLALIRQDRIVYFRDVYDHLIRLTDELDSYRELVSTTLDIYLSQVNNNLSEIMKRLTAVTVILAGIGAVAGIFGMSEAGLAFDFKEQAGFWVVTALSIGIGGLALIFFRRSGWI
jgi:magnesium transporter